jgi:hypothetical protein
VNRIGGKPDEDCTNSLLFGYQLEQGVDLLKLEVPDHMAFPPRMVFPPPPPTITHCRACPSVLSQKCFYKLEYICA